MNITKSNERKTFYVLDCFGRIIDQYTKLTSPSEVLANIEKPRFQEYARFRMYVCDDDNVWVVEEGKERILSEKRCTFTRTKHLYDDGHIYSSLFFPLDNIENRHRLGKYIKKEDLHWMVEQILSAGYRLDKMTKLVSRPEGVHFLYIDEGMSEKISLIEEIWRLNKELRRVLGTPRFRIR